MKKILDTTTICIVPPKPDLLTTNNDTTNP